MKRKGKEKVYSVHFVSRALDKADFIKYLEVTYGASNIKVKADVYYPDPKTVSPQDSFQHRKNSAATKILSALSDNKIHAVGDLKRAAGVQQVNTVLIKLIEAKEIVRVAHGHYIISGKGAPKGPTTSAANLGGGQRRIYELLEIPQTAVQLRDKLSVSRQAVDAALKKLQRNGHIIRFNVTNERGQHLYIRKDIDSTKALSSRTVQLRPSAAQVLSQIPKLGMCKVTEIMRLHGEGKRSLVRRWVFELRQHGLVELSGSRNRLLVQLTNQGREHPQYDMNELKAAEAPMNDPVSQRKSYILWTLYILGEAKAIELTYVTGFGRGRSPGGVGMGQYLQRLVATGFVERPSGTRKHVRYKLTPMGTSYVSSAKDMVTFPGEEEIRNKLKNEIEKERERLRGQAKNFSTNQPNRLQDILNLLKEVGPLATTKFNSLLPRPYNDPRSLNLALKTLKDRNEIIVIGREEGRSAAYLWGLKEVI